MISKYKLATKNYYECYTPPITKFDILLKTWFLCIIQIHLLCKRYWKDYEGKRLSAIYEYGRTFTSDVVWVKFSAIYWIWRLCYDWWAKPIKDFGETDIDEISWDRLVRKFGNDVRKVICVACDELLGYYVSGKFDFSLDTFGETCDLKTQYVSSDTEYIWSSKGLEGDICQGCSDSVTGGTRFKIYKGELRYNVIFDSNSLVYDAIGCENAELFNEFEHIIFYLIDGKQEETERIRVESELYTIDLPSGYSYIHNKLDHVKYRLIQLADTFDLPLFRLGCSNYDLILYTNKESHDLFQAITCELEHNSEKDLDFEAIAKEYEIDIINDVS